MVIRMRHTSGHTRNRRSHHALKAKQLTKCADCDAMVQSHIVCDVCGKYKGRQIITIKEKKVLA
jgi:large subunit ribosomal protein L32